MKWYSIQPCDAWFFRDGRPMNRGQDSHAVDSLFPPQAPTVIGAIRAALARHQGWDGKSDWSTDIKAVLGDGFEDLGLLNVTGPLLALNWEPLFICPRHLLGYRNSKGDFEPADWLRPSKSFITCDLGNVKLPVPPTRSKDGRKLVQGERVYLSLKGMNAVLDGKLPSPNDCTSEDRLFCSEPRVGIALNETSRTTGEGDLFNPRYVRLKTDVSLLVGLSGLPGNWILPSLFPFGGEARLAQSEELDQPPNLPSGAKGKILTLLTPGFFGEPWYGATPGEASSKLGALQGEVVTCAVDRPERVYGWNSQKLQPLTTDVVAPQGTVWWLSETNGKATVQIGQRANHGYGLAVTGVAPDDRK